MSRKNNTNSHFLFDILFSISYKGKSYTKCRNGKSYDKVFYIYCFVIKYSSAVRITVRSDILESFSG